MNAQDIRELNEKLQEQMLNSQSPVEHDAGFKSLLLSLLAEIAAQNAEATALLKRHLNPPLGYDKTNIGPNERMGFSDDLPQPIFMAMEPRATMRDQFAMEIMPTFIEKYSLYNSSYSSIIGLGVNPLTEKDLERMVQESEETLHSMVKEAYKWADYMIEARKQ